MNKKFIQFILVLGLLLNTAWAWHIKEFNVEAEIQSDGSVNITETIKADFSDNLKKHGIVRNIPFEYRDQNEQIYTTPLTDISVKDSHGGNHKFVKTKSGSDIRLKIGDGNKFVKPSETYVIKYSVEGVLNAFENHDEFYWNVTGNEWDAPIKKATALIMLPRSSETIQAKCFTGRNGSTDQNCEYQLNELRSGVGFKTTQDLNIREGFTIVFGWDKGLVAIPERKMSFDLEGWAKKYQYIFLLFPAWAAIKNFRIRNRLKPKKAVIPLYHPPAGLGVGLIGYFYRGKSSIRDLTALITQLCVKGLISIKETDAAGPFQKPDYEITALTPPANYQLDKEEQFVYDHLVLKPGESMSLKALVRRKNSIFKFKNYTRLLSHINQETKGYLRSGNFSLLKLIIGIVLGFHLFFASIVFSGLAQSVVPFIAFVIGSVTALALPKFNKDGQLIQHDIKGYKKFLMTADKKKINWSEAQNIFEANLPYAIALNVTDKWAQVFGDKIQTPDWYEGQSISNIKSLEKGITKTATRSISASAPRSTSSSRGRSGFSRGGGRSGGGSGGGGGSSW